MSVSKFFAEVLGGSASEIVKGLGETADRFIQTKEEKAQFQLAIKESELKFRELAHKGEQEYSKDRQSAREMYMQDSSLQKTFALVFLIAYCIISAGMIAMIIAMAFFDKAIDLPEWGVMLISSVFTGMSMKVNTITDFLFGGSKAADNSVKGMTNTFKSGQSPE